MNIAATRNTDATARHKNSEQRYVLLYELFRSISSTLDPQKALNLIIDAAVEITSATNATLNLIDWEREVLVFKVSRGFLKQISGLQLKVGEGITGWVARHGKPLLVRDVSSDPRYVKLKDEIKSELAVPLEIDGKLIGVVNVESVELNAFDAEDLEHLTLLSKQSAQVIKNSQLFDTAKRKVEELSTLIEINKNLVRTRSLDKILNQIVSKTAHLMDSSLCSLRLLSEDREELVLSAHCGGGAGYRKHLRISVRNSLLGGVVSSQKPLQVADVRDESDYLLRELAQQEGLCSLLSVPLKVRKKMIGVINIYKSSRYLFSDDELMLVGSFADQCAVAIENARLYEKMRYMEEQARRSERLAVVGELAVGIAHEIRNPLTIMQMIFESDGGLVEKDIEIISAEMERMNKIISHFLDYAKPNEPIQEECDVNEILRDAQFLLSHAFKRKKIKLKSRLEKQLPIILADRSQLQQVILNLLLNSTEALPDGGQITLRSARRKDEVQIEIQDNGPGIDARVMQKLFLPFTTTKPNGLGIGLSIAKRIIDAHNGQFSIKSSAEDGTVATVKLPIIRHVS